ncbi:DUF4955 domain-containing protein [Paraglaciecola sp. L3A3]|uniref:DUF4955 domain-containing protein n=1 Tax=Paraglaciecola sp. L3A3 TaxID=2686358 RepID=UPI00131E96DD|nr:DUF4955 domain-containing protein [Paraglaciecola sp. L3A3]
MKRVLCLATIFVFTACGQTVVKQNNAIEKNTSENVTPWQAYLPDNPAAVFLDYSAVGVNYSNSAIPTLQLPVFDVTNYGAIADDDVEDKAGIQQAIKAAEKAGGGIVYFPAGRFLINESPDRRSGLSVGSSRVVLRGSGNDTQGTELFMRYPLAPQDPKKMWTVPPMIKFQPLGASAPSSSKQGKYIAESVIVKNAKQNDSLVVVKDAGRFKAGDVVTLDMQNTAANDDFMFNKQPRDSWQEVIKNGVRASETLEIAEVKGDKIYFKQPLITRINADYKWKIRSIHTINNVGIENLRFSGNFKDKFAHHKNATHDSGYTAVQLNRTTHSWVQNVVFRDVSVAATISGGVANSMMLNVIEGNRGHSCFNITFGTRNLTALNIDKTNDGQWHGPGASHLSVGNVIWRFVSPKSRGIDSHGLFPRFSLYDNITSFGFGGWGGNYKNLPNHLEGLVFWNFKQTGNKVGEWHKDKFNFWDVDAPKEQAYTFFSAVNPVLIGYEGSAEGYLDEHTGHVASFGKRVALDSLYEAQLSERLGETPKWLGQRLSEWQELLIKHDVED